MKRRAFTLMELLISVVLIALISMYLYGALGQTRSSNKALQTHTRAEEHRLKIYELLYRDLVEAYSLGIVRTKDKHYHLLELRTGNSLYDIAAPYVIYYVHADTLQLIRMESAEPITLPVRDMERERIHADLIDENVTDLNLYVQNETKSETGKPAAANSGMDENNASGASEARKFANHLLYIATKQDKTPLLMELAF